MAKKLDRESLAALAELKAYDGGRGREPNWERGTLGTLRHFVIECTKDARISLPDTTLERIAEDVHELHGQEPGMAAQVNDLAYQQWLADSLAIAVRHALEATRLNSKKSNRQLLLHQIDTLCLTLQENLDVVDLRKNRPPTLDLALESNPIFLEEIRRLNNLLEKTRKAVARRPLTKPPTLVAKALNQFVTSLASSAGDGLGRTVTLMTRLILVAMAISILNELGVSLSPFLSSIKAIISK